MLVAPVVHLQRRVIHAHILDAVFQLMEDIRPRGVQILVVHTIDQNKMAENVVGYGFAPCECLSCFQCDLHLLFEKANVVIHQVALRHIGVQEFQGISGLFIRYLVDILLDIAFIAARHLLHTLIIVVIHLLPVVLVGQNVSDHRILLGRQRMSG